MVGERRALLVPGAANALTARIVQDLGFEAVYLTGAGLTNASLGMPDLGLVTSSELADATARLADSCELPLIVDMDTGFGNALNVHRTVRTLERMGACALQIEDQVFPKKCGHFEGKQVVPLEEMLGKVKAALDSRQDENLLIIARTDSRSVLGLDAAMERALAMREAGADVTFVEAPVSLEEMRRVGALEAPQVANIVFGGRTPLMGQAELREMGFALVLYANAALQAAMRAMQEVLTRLRDAGGLAGAEDLMVDFEERQRLLDKARFDAMERRYGGS